MRSLIREDVPPTRVRAGAATALTSAVLMLAGALAGCGDDGARAPGAGTSPPGTPAASSSTRPGAGDTAPNSAALRALDFVLVEGPETAGLEPAEPSDSDYPEPPVPDAGLAEAATCLGVSSDALLSVVRPRAAADRANSLTFVSPDNTTSAYSEAWIMAPERIDEVRAIVTDSDFPRCFAPLLPALTGDDGLWPTVSNARTPDLPEGATGGLRCDLLVEDDGLPMGEPFTLDLITVTEGQVHSVLTVTHLGGPPPPTLLDATVSQLVTKIRNQ